jgi:hypothetical protein
MSRQTAALKPKYDPKLVSAFLNAAHGFDTTRPDSSNRTTFATVVAAGLKAGLVTKDSLIKKYGFSAGQLSRVKNGQSIGLEREDRHGLLQAMRKRANSASDFSVK